MEMRNQIKQAVIDYITLHGYPPTMQEIGQAVGRCKSVINGYVTQMLVDGELETDAMQGAPRALRVPGMRWINTQEYVSVVRQLARLQEHCREMAAEPGSAEAWQRDVEALDLVMAALGKVR